MGYGMRVSVPGIDVLSGTANTNGFALRSDDSTVLIKEKSRGTVTLNYASSQSVAHGLSYVPLCLFWGYESTNAGTLDYIGGQQNPIELAQWIINTDGTNLHITQGANPSGSATGFYYIFYDQVK